MLKKSTDFQKFSTQKSVPFDLSSRTPRAVVPNRGAVAHKGALKISRGAAKY